MAAINTNAPDEQQPTPATDPAFATPISRQNPVAVGAAQGFLRQLTPDSPPPEAPPVKQPMNGLLFYSTDVMLAKVDDFIKEASTGALPFGFALKRILLGLPPVRSTEFDICNGDSRAIHHLVHVFRQFVTLPIGQGGPTKQEMIQLMDCVDLAIGALKDLQSKPVPQAGARIKRARNAD